jgi:hypothetical protein
MKMAQEVVMAASIGPEWDMLFQEERGFFKQTEILI